MNGGREFFVNNTYKCTFFFKIILFQKVTIVNNILAPLIRKERCFQISLCRKYLLFLTGCHTLKPCQLFFFLHLF